MLRERGQLKNYHIDGGRQKNETKIKILLHRRRGGIKKHDGPTSTELSSLTFDATGLEAETKSRRREGYFKNPKSRVVDHVVDTLI